MKVEERAIGDVTILTVEGRLAIDAPHDERLADKVRSLLKQGRKRIVLDLAGVSHIDSTGLCDIVTAYTTTIRRDGSLKLLSPSRPLFLSGRWLRPSRPRGGWAPDRSREPSEAVR